MKLTPRKTLWLAIFVSALGYFVDVYDIILFTAVRVSSLKSLSVPDSLLASTGLYLMNLQLVGMLVGGIIWGVLADKRGRLSVLFGSIFLYSVANIANSFVHDIGTYAVLRFIAGLGLAGELGTGVTLVSEMMSKEKRGLGTMIIVIAGMLGGVAGGFVGDLFPWRHAYLLGGLMGFALLILRIGVTESGIFVSIKGKAVERGNLLFFIRSRRLMSKYIRCLLIGLPMWIFIGLFMTLAPEIGEVLKIHGAVSAGKSIMFYNVGLGFGNLSSSLLSQLLKSRKKSAALFLGMCLVFLGGFFVIHEASPAIYYTVCVLLGFSSGYWAVFLMISSEQFGTNRRATATTSLPNFVRGMVVPYTIAFGLLSPSLGVLWSMGLIGFSCTLVSIIALRSLQETFSKSLEFVES
jgi:MFS family permease